MLLDPHWNQNRNQQYKGSWKKKHTIYENKTINFETTHGHRKKLKKNFKHIKLTHYKYVIYQKL